MLEMMKEVNIRVVRCPRCRVLLPELPDHPLYRCGNCETVIQAKNKGISIAELESDLAETERNLNDKLGSDGVELDGVITSVSEGPSTSPEIACQRNEYSLPISDDELSLKGKSKLEESDDKSKNRLPEEDDEMKLNYEYIHSHSPPLSESHVSLYLTSPDQDNDHLYQRGPDFGISSLLDTSASSPFMDLSSDYDLKPQSSSKNLGTTSYYAYDGSESSCDGTDDHILQPSRKTKEMLMRDGFRSKKLRPLSRRSRRNSPHSQPQRDVSRSPFDPPESESEKLDLLRTVWELKDQLNLMHLSKDKDQNFTPIHHYDRPFSRPAFLGKSMQYEIPVSCYCLHCYPRDVHWSSQLPVQCKNRNQYGHNYCDNSSSMRSPRQHIRKNMTLWGTETNSEDVKKKTQTLRIHLLPVAGGAPFVACYNCWEVLQIPAEFIIIKKRYHKLMCSSCKKILKFSLQKDTHLAPYDPTNGVLPAPPQNPVSHSSPCQFQSGRRSCSKRGNRRRAISVNKEVPRSTSPLHHLMGYSSARHVLDI